MEARVQRVLIWAGPITIVFWMVSFIFIAGWFPPSDPLASAADIVTLYKSHTNAIKLGMVICMATSALLVPFGSAISGQLKRIDGARALADTQLVSCGLLSLEFSFPTCIWMVVSYRFDGRDPDVTRAQIVVQAAALSSQSSSEQSSAHGSKTVTV
jgi:hypothetical protein